MQRITLRDRPYERAMEREYIDELNAAYENYFGSGRSSQRYGRSQVLLIDTDSLNFVNQAEDLKWVENRIRQALHQAPYQPELPLEIGSEPGVS
jgi:deoxyguanosine kinase